MRPQLGSFPFQELFTREDLATASAAFLAPYLTPGMLSDFTACGGVIFVATGLRMCGIKIFPVINMLPSMLIIMPLSALWARYVG